MVKTKDQIKKSVFKYIEKLKKDITISRVILFGSYAYNNPREYSDIDLAIFSPDFSHDNPMKDMQFLSHATRGCDTSIEALAYRPEDYHNYERGSFLHEIIKNGKVMYEESNED